MARDPGAAESAQVVSTAMQSKEGDSAPANQSSEGGHQGGNAPQPPKAQHPPARRSYSNDPDRPLPLPYQRSVKNAYESSRSQLFIAALIVVNFLMTCFNKFIDPQSKKHLEIWNAGNMAFNIIFTIELCINLYGRWWCEFWSNNWNRFDFVVVAIGIVDMAWKDMPGPLRLIRMLRAFRVFRLFSRVESMRKIIESIAHAIPGMLNAFLINFILLSIYAVLSVDFFSLLYCDPNDFDFARANPLTARNVCWGDDYYGDFLRAFYTMFQVLTGESWSEAAARPALAFYMDKDDVLYVILTYVFFYSFVLVNCFVLLNVVVAVLMDGMNNASEEPVDETGMKLDHILELLNRHEQRFDEVMDEIFKLRGNAGMLNGYQHHRQLEISER